VRRDVYVHLDGFGRARKNGRRRNRPFDPRTILDASAEIRGSRANTSVAAASGTAGAGSTGRASSCGTRAWPGKVAARSLFLNKVLNKVFE
jgi:hypothetical protein